MGRSRGRREPEPPEPPAPPGRRGGASPEGAFRPEDFEEVELPVALPPQAEAAFEDVDLRVPLAAAPPPDARLRAAKGALERRPLLDVAQQALAAHSGTDALGFENIVGVGIGRKLVAGRETGVPCVVVYVVAKARPGEVEAGALVPPEVDGVPTDVVPTGELRALPHRGRYRPAPAGVSVGHFRITAGTIACLVRRGTALYVLSNNHVLADVNAGAPGDPVLQPGPTDGGRVPEDVVARLSRFVPIAFGGALNRVDGAIAQASPSLVTNATACFGRVGAEPLACRLDLLVRKCGRSTQFTRGRITDCSATVRVGYGTAGTALFQDQIIVESLTGTAFSAPGDSGSLVVADAGSRPVGLLFAGSATHTIANHIADVLQALDVAIVA
jgi:hypothetical protein